MKEWFENLSVLEHIYLWIGVVATVFLIIQIILMCFTSFGGDVDVDSGVSIFTVKSLTAFFAVGSWCGLLTCSLASESLQWLSVIIALATGGAAMSVVIILLRAMAKMQYNGTMQPETLVGKQATVYISIPAERSGRGKITLTAQGRYMELDAMTEGEKLFTDESVEIIATENECAVVRRVQNEEKTTTAEKGDELN